MIENAVTAPLDTVAVPAKLEPSPLSTVIEILPSVYPEPAALTLTL